jgi:hypothetical protein
MTAARSALRWHLLIHSLPPKPLYLRAKVHRRLLKAGAVALKDAVFALPGRAQRLEELRSIADEAVAGGGKAYLCEAGFFDPSTDALLVEEFGADRSRDYMALAEVVADWGRNPPEPAALVRARKRFDAIARIDFFESLERRPVEEILQRAEARRKAPPTRTRLARERPDLVGRLWATRPGVQVDRIASAWLIRRFIDPGARFRFIDPKQDRIPDEIRFDIVGGDFTHEGDSCTFETLVRLLPDPDLALRQVAEIVHDIDLKDGKFNRADAAGVQQVLLGIVLDCPADEARLRRGFALFDDLYASFRKRSSLGKGDSK